jgi:hypothetical protein
MNVLGIVAALVLYVGGWVFVCFIVAAVAKGVGAFADIALFPLTLYTVAVMTASAIIAQITAWVCKVVTMYLGAKAAVQGTGK